MSLPSVETVLPLAASLPAPELVRGILVEFLGDSVVLGESKMLVGGLTNQIVQQSTNVGDLILRIFGNNSEMFIDRARELAWCLHLNKFQIGPEIVGLFGNGRVERFLPGKTLTPEDLQNDEIHPITAAEIARLHKIPLDTHLTANFSDLIEQWIVAVGGIKLQGAKKEQIDKIDLTDTISLLRRSLEVLAKCTSPLVATHNDLLSGNFLLEDSGKIHLLDFEYAMRNKSCFDIANHWCEWIGFDCQLAYDWTKFPSDVQQHEFCRFYLMAFNNGNAPTHEEIETLKREVLACTVLANLYWGIWAVLQTAYSTIDFDYATYAIMRIKRAQETATWLDL